MYEFCILGVHTSAELSIVMGMQGKPAQYRGCATGCRTAADALP